MPRKKAPQPALRPRRPRGSGTVFYDKRRKVWVGRVHGQEFRHVEQARVADWLRTAAPPAPGSAVTVGEWLDRWLAAIKVRPNTRSTYALHVEQRLRPAFGATALTRLTAWEIEAAANRWQGKPATVRGALAVLGTALRAAVRAGLLDRSPAALVRRPDPGEQRFDLFARAELRAIFDAGLGRADWRFAAVLAATGCRIGEALALAPGDHDAAAGRLRIERQRARSGGTAPVKSKKSARVIEVPAELAPALTAPGAGSYATALRHWRALLAHLGLRYRAPHQVRHSVATYLLADGFPLADLARHLGHTPAELLKTYGHATGASAAPPVRRLLGLS